MVYRRNLVYSVTAVILLSVLSVCLPALSATIHVKPIGNDANDGLSWESPKKTIQAAINAASSGDEIWVLTGTYLESLTLKEGVGVYGGFVGLETAREQRDYTWNETIVDGSGWVVAAGATGATLDGFTLRNGSGSGNSGVVYCAGTSPVLANNKISGGYNGVYCNNGSPTITDNEISGSYAVYCTNSSAPTISQNKLSGIYCYTSSPSITNNTITGGGVSCNYASSPVIAGNTISNSGYNVYCDSSSPTVSENVLSDGSYGVYCTNTSAPTITGNSIKRNTQYGIYTNNSSPAITRNSITGNTNWAIYCNSSGVITVTDNLLALNGNGMYSSNTSPVMTNNTIACNTYEGIWFSGGSSSFVNNIVAFNRTGILRTDGSLTTCYNDVYGNGTNYSGVTIGAGDLSVDPVFANVAGGDFHIQPSSLCRNAGLNSAPSLPSLDMDGEPRIQGGTVDMGADESDGTLWPTQLRIVHVDASAPTGGDGASWNSAYRTIGEAIADVGRLGGAEIWVAASTYNERVTLLPFAHLYGGFLGFENSRNERDWAWNETVIDAGGAGNVVGGANGSSVDGFTLRNTYNSGYGVVCQNTSPRIANNKIISNYYGIYCYTSRPEIVNNNITSNNNIGVYCGNGASPSITGNTLSSNGSYNIRCEASTPVISGNKITGGSYGIDCSSSSPSITGNTITSSYTGINCASSSSPTITGNTLSGSPYGIGCYSSSSPVISGNKINNSASYGIYANACSPTITLNSFTANTNWAISCESSGSAVVTGNTLSYNGKGFYSNNTSPVVTNNTIAFNTYEGINFTGGSPKLTNNVVAFNQTGVYRSGGSFIRSYNDVYGNVTNYSGVTASTGDISEDPVFANIAGGDFHIQPSSLCRNAGLNSAPSLPAVDMDGEPRIQGGTVDMGADESDGTLWPTQLRIVHVDASAPAGGNGASWITAYRTIGAAIANVNGFGGAEVWVAANTYNERISLIPFAHLYGGFTGTETDRSQRNWYSNQTIIDGGNGGHVVIGANASTLDGFTLRNSTNNYGISCFDRSPTIRNNRITGMYMAIRCNASSALLVNNVVYGNQYGVMCDGTGSPRIINNTMSDNSPYGMYCGGTTSPIMTNNILAFNYYGIVNSAANPQTDYNCVVGNTQNYSGLNAGTHDISLDPLFVNRGGRDYHLGLGSPCINAGLNSVLGLATQDMDGDPRICWGTVDIGADEYADQVAEMGTAKLMPVNVAAVVGDAIVSAAFSGFFYVEADDKSHGIRVDKTAHGLTAGMRAHVSGTTAKNGNDERYIAATSVRQTGSGTLHPLFMTNVAIGGGDWQYNPATGTGQRGISDPITTVSNHLNNMGLLVRTSGAFTYVDAHTFTIDDGSSVNVKCVVPDGVTLDQNWTRALVTGVSSCEVAGSELHRLLRVRSRDDIVPY